MKSGTYQLQDLGEEDASEHHPCRMAHRCREDLIKADGTLCALIEKASLETLVPMLLIVSYMHHTSLEPPLSHVAFSRLFLVRGLG